MSTIVPETPAATRKNEPGEQPKYVVAVPPSLVDEITITCPPWCEVPRRDHLIDLHDWEGFVLHQSSRVVAGVEVQHSRSTYPDGTPDPDNSGDDFHVQGMELSVVAAEHLAAAILELVQEARQS